MKAYLSSQSSRTIKHILTKAESEIANDIYLASERQEMLVNELGSKAVTSVLLGSLDMVVDTGLGLEPLLAALIGAGERAQTSVIHQMILESMA